MSRGPVVRTSEDQWLWKPNRSFRPGCHFPKTDQRRRAKAGQAGQDVRLGAVLALIAVSALVLAFGMSGSDVANVVERPRRAIAVPVEEQYSEVGDHGPGGREGPERSGYSELDAEASSGMDLMLDVDTLRKDLILRVLEADEEGTKEIVTPRFFEDLEYNRAILQHAELEELQIERQGNFWIQGRTPFHLPPPMEGLPGKTGLAQLRMVFMDGRWKLHELGLSVQ
jgi:hypothetical protein